MFLCSAWLVGWKAIEKGITPKFASVELEVDTWRNQDRAVTKA
jgi:hypothetical protein